MMSEAVDAPDGHRCEATASAPGKLVLIGEYAVLEGADALVMAVDRRAEVGVRAAPGEHFVVRAPHVGVEEAALLLREDGCLEAAAHEQRRLDLVCGVLNEARQSAIDAGLCPVPLEIQLDTAAFFDDRALYKLGLGSSAAVTVALLAATLSAWQGQSQHDLQALQQTAHRSHRRAQAGAGSGIDVAASVHGGLQVYTLTATGSRCESLSLPASLHIVPVDSGAPAETPTLLAAVRRLAERDPVRHASLMSAMARTASEGVNATRADDVSGFLRAAAVYGDIMAELGQACLVPIVTEAHAAIAREVQRAGGVYKPSGAGGGDLGVALCEGAAMRERVLRAISVAGFRVVPLAIAERGVLVNV